MINRMDEKNLLQAKLVSDDDRYNIMPSVRQIIRDLIAEIDRSREAEIVLAGKCSDRSAQIEKLLNSNSDLLDVIIKKGKEYSELQTEFNQLHRDKANLEKINQSWKDACQVQQKLVEDKNKTIKKLRSEIEQCKQGAHYGR